jgi:nucleotidyltransferase/DNA polymerase involved in DNA repair
VRFTFRGRRRSAALRPHVSQWISVAIFAQPRFDVYKEVSLQIRAIFAEHTAIIEPLSLDEAYLDVTENLQGIASGTEIAEQIRAKIRAETQLTASAGVSYNKFLAKLASDYRKPDGLFVVTPAMGSSFVEALPVERFHGVGPATAADRAVTAHYALPAIYPYRDITQRVDRFGWSRTGRHRREAHRHSVEQGATWRCTRSAASAGKRSY